MQTPELTCQEDAGVDEFLILFAHGFEQLG
jgi:hypothetical protein